MAATIIRMVWCNGDWDDSSDGDAGDGDGDGIVMTVVRASGDDVMTAMTLWQW